MERHEMKARIDAQIAEWKRNIHSVQAKAEESGDGAKSEYLRVSDKLGRQLDDFTIEAAKAWDSTDDSWDKASTDLELKWEQWQLDAKKAWVGLTG